MSAFHWAVLASLGALSGLVVLLLIHVSGLQRRVDRLEDT